MSLSSDKEFQVELIYAITDLVAAVNHLSGYSLAQDRDEADEAHRRWMQYSEEINNVLARLSALRNMVIGNT